MSEIRWNPQRTRLLLVEGLVVHPENILKMTGGDLRQSRSTFGTAGVTSMLLCPCLERVRAVVAALEIFAPTEERQELLLALPVKRHTDGAVLIKPRPALDRKSVLLDGDFDGFL